MTTVSFELSKANRITLSVFDVQGRLVRTLADDVFTAGGHALEFDGAGLSSGIYFARIATGASTRTQKLVLLK